MTYKQLLDILKCVPSDVLEQTVTVHLIQTDEYIAATELSFSKEDNDVLDEGHLFVQVDF